MSWMLMSSRVAKPSATIILNMRDKQILYQYLIKRLIVRPRKVSKPRDLYLELFDSSEIWHLGSSAVDVLVKFERDTII